ncbi:MMPL family transporter [Streptomyces sp. G-5]|uniref:MMPL family transporter n=1 Tax=Streptomyces sp. G-5 TaxID=2977231 RepID=UPI0021CF9EAB|nr:MMPL family transporter [Streptomyces sp. G-5]MCU4745394.1 MMPL family transporter [Streptomyces sp. G-5]
MASLLHRWALIAVGRRRRVVALWLLAVSVIAVLSVRFAGDFEAGSTIPGSAAERSLATMEEHFGASNQQTADIVFETPAGASFQDPDQAEALRGSLEAARSVPGVESVSDPARTGLVSPDGRTALVRVTFSAADDQEVGAFERAALQDTTAGSRAAGMEVTFGGDAFEEKEPPVSTAEAIGLLVALVVLVITFGSLLSAGMPLITALISVLTSMTALVGFASMFSISNKAPSLALMLGLAVGIDYALFIVSRHRRELAHGRTVREAIARATATAGSAVTFAALTVIIALVGLAVAGVPMLTSMGVSAAGAVAVAALTSLGLLPALLATAGERLRPSPGSRAARLIEEAESPGDTTETKPPLGTRWVALVARCPWRTLVIVTLALSALALPATQLHLALTDHGGEPASTEVRQSYDKVSDAFGPGANGPLVVLVTNTSRSALEETAERTAAELRYVDGIARTSPVEYAPDGAAARIQVIPETGPRDPKTADLVSEIEAGVGPLARESGSEVAVTGQTAVSIEVSEKLSASLLPFALVVVGLSVLLLMAAFRSVAIPIKATLGFLLSVAASLGVVVAVFQWGWLAGPLGVPATGPVFSFVPIIVMAVLFGLAMDYEVFLVSAMREDYLRTRDPRAAIIGGARHSARVVTAAAVIMIAVFAGFLVSHDPAIMPIALGLTVGVLIDAFAVRMTLMVAVMSVLGRRAWRLPVWLDRWLPNLDVEGAAWSENVRAPGQAADLAPQEAGVAEGSKA